MRVIVDAYGGDNAPLEVVKGAVQARDAYGVEIVLTGNEEEIRRIAKEQELSLDGIEIVHATDVIEMSDSPKSILREHKDCTMAVGLRLLAEGRGDAFVSAGSTGALLMGGSFIIKRIKGISRAALAAIMPAGGREKPYMLLDSGANVECRPEMLLQFAQMGSLYMTHLFNDGEPATVGLLNVGTEDTKGGELQREAHALLRESDLNFIGNVEARDVPSGVADVIVADGFSGNVLLKTVEGTAHMVMGFVKGVFYANLLTKLSALLVKSRLSGLKKKMSTAEYGGAPLLGVSKPVIKAHGNSNALAIQNAVRVAAEFAKAGVIEKITEQLQKEEVAADGAAKADVSAE